MFIQRVIGVLLASAVVVAGDAIHLRLDGLSALFLALLCVIGAAGAVYARSYWSDGKHPRSARAGRTWWSVLLLSLGCMLAVTDGNLFGPDAGLVVICASPALALGGVFLWLGSRRLKR